MSGTAETPLAAKLRTLRPTRALVDLDAIAANFLTLRERAGDADVLCVVKADGYGHGAVPVARRLEAEGARWLGVALVEEGIELRAAGLLSRVLLLGGCPSEQVDLALDHGLTPAIVSRESLRVLMEAARRRGESVRCHLKIDTGMTRLGVPWDQLASVLREITGDRGRGGQEPALEVEGLLTHLACSDDPSVPHTRTQLERFRRSLVHVEQATGRRPLVHVASSAGLLTRAEREVELVRPGLALYGLNPFGNEAAPELVPAMSLVSRVVRVVDVPAGTPVGYGSTFITVRASRLATLPVGYDDGLSRLLSDHWEVGIAGESVPLVGRVSMDLCVADVTNVPGVKVGDEVTIVGRGGGARSIEEMAQRLGTIPYEVACRIGWRVPRVYLEGGRPVAVRSRFDSWGANEQSAQPSQRSP